MNHVDGYSLTALADLAGVTPRTVRYYLAQGLLPATGQSGPGTRYDIGHLERLRLIRRLQSEHLPLAEIRRRLAGLDASQIHDLAGREEPPPPPDSAMDYLRTILERPESSRPLTAPIAPAPAAAAPTIPTRSLLTRSVAEPAAERYGSMPADATARPPERSQWERIVLADDVELHLRRPLSRAQNKQVDRLVTIARELLEEDRS